jgi:hypothetical protein
MIMGPKPFTIKTMFFITLIVFGLGSNLKSQVVSTADSTVDRNLIKLNFLSLVFFNTTTLNYERSIGDKMSVGVGAGRRFSGSLPGLFQSSESDLTISDSDLTGLFFNLEFRWYLDKCNDKGDMKGLYIGPYLKVNRLSLDFDTEFDPGEELILNSGQAKLVEIGLGGLIGYQLELWDKVTIDFMFFGPRISRFNLSFGFKNEISEEFTGSIEDNVNGILEKVLMNGGVDFDIEKKEIKTDFFRTAFKYGIGIGYKF